MRLGRYDRNLNSESPWVSVNACIAALKVVFSESKLVTALA